MYAVSWHFTLRIHTVVMNLRIEHSVASHCHTMIKLTWCICAKEVIDICHVETVCNMLRLK